jgi:hypothetical protein
MIREIIIPSNNSYLLKIPDHYVGKPLQIIAFPLNEKEEGHQPKTGRSLEEIKKFFSNYHIDMSNFKFNRDDANDYE